MKRVLKSTTLRGPFGLAIFLGVLLGAQALAYEAVAVYEASEGPVQATLRLNRAKIGDLTVSYRGPLFQCNCFSYLCRPNAVNAIFSATLNYKLDAHKVEMNPQCRGSDYTSVTIGRLDSYTAIWWPFKDIEVWRDILGDIAHYYQTDEFPETFRDISVSFESNGNWDSDFGRNYKLKFKRVNSE